MRRNDDNITRMMWYYSTDLSICPPSEGRSAAILHRLNARIFLGKGCLLIPTRVSIIGHQCIVVVSAKGKPQITDQLEGYEIEMLVGVKRRKRPLVLATV